MIGATKGIRLAPRVVLPLAILFLIGGALTIVFGLDVRGSDQYWYLAETATLAEGGPAVTNLRYPGPLLRGEVGDEPLPFAHNGVLEHLLGRVARSIGALDAWRLGNVLWWLGTAVLTGVAVAGIAGRQAGAWAAVLHGSAPLAVWQALNLLRESWFGFLSAILLVVLVHRRRHPLLAWILLPAVFVGGLSHPAYLVAGACLALTAAFLWRELSLAGALAATVGGAALLGPEWFPNSMAPSALLQIRSAIPNVTNMLWQFAVDVPPLSLDLLRDKLVVAVQRQWLTSERWLFNFHLNLGLVAWAVLCLRRARRHATVLVASGIAFGLYGAMAVLLQNDARYQMLVMPFAITCAVLAWELVPYAVRRRGPWLLGALVPVLLADVTLLLHVREEAREERAVLERFDRELDRLAPFGRVAILSGNATGKLGLATRLGPRPVLLADTDLIAPADLERALRLFSPELVLQDADPDDPDTSPGDLQVRAPDGTPLGALRRRP